MGLLLGIDYSCHPCLLTSDPYVALRGLFLETRRFLRLSNPRCRLKRLPQSLHYRLPKKVVSVGTSLYVFLGCWLLFTLAGHRALALRLFPLRQIADDRFVTLGVELHSYFGTEYNFLPLFENMFHIDSIHLANIF